VYIKTSLKYTRITLFLFVVGPKLVSHTETRIQPKVLEKRVVREYLEIRREKDREVLRILSNEECHDLYLYLSPNIITMFISRRIRWVGQISCMGEKRNA
jgi:hypothetical protein